MPFLTNSPYTLISGALTTEYSDAPDNTQPLTNIYRVLINYPSNNSQMTVSQGAVIEAIGAFSTGILTVTPAQITHNGTITTSWIGVELQSSGGLYVGPSGIIDSAQAVRLGGQGTRLINDGTLMASLVGVEGWDSIQAINNGSVGGIIGILVYGTSNQPNTGSRIANNGAISAFQTGIDLSDVNSTVLNSGVITAGQIGIKLTASHAAAGAYTVTNTGVISAQTAIQGSAFRETLTNEGVLDGAVNLGGDDDFYMGVLGSVTGIIRLDGDGDTDPANDPIGNDTAYGGLGNETIDAGHGNNLVDGGGGDDTIEAGNGNDVLRGGGGNDSLLAGDGDNVLEGGDGDDLLAAGAGNDAFVGGAGVDTVILLGGDIAVDLRLSVAQATGLGSDRFIGIEHLTAGSGNDVLIGSGLDNWLIAAGGNDTLEGEFGDDTLDGGAGIDVARYSGPAAAKVNLARQGAQDTGYGFDTLISIENLEGGSGDDLFTGNDHANRLVGNGGNDTLIGGKGDDLLDGGAGRNLAVYSGARDDYLVGVNEDGSLTITDTVGQDGTDLLKDVRFGQFSDGTFALFNANPTEVTISNLRVAENAAPSTVVGNVSALDQDGDALTYTLLSSAGGLFALDGVKLVLKGSVDYEAQKQHSVSVKVSDPYGGEAVQSFTISVTDVVEVVPEPPPPPPPPLPPAPVPLNLRGTSRADNLTGGAGDDLIAGGQGRDLLTGGPGRDAFLFDTRPNAKTNVDGITDFSITDDTIHLSKKIFSKIAKEGVLAGNAFWTGDKTHDASDRIFYNKKTGGLFYDADGNGTGKAVQFAVLDKGLKLAAEDFFVV